VNFMLRLSVVVAIASPLLAAAQPSSQGLTREQVQNEMVRYRAAGFNPARANPSTWVNDAQGATAKVANADLSAAHPRLADNGASTGCN